MAAIDDVYDVLWQTKLLLAGRLPSAGAPGTTSDGSVSASAASTPLAVAVVNGSYPYYAEARGWTDAGVTLFGAGVARLDERLRSGGRG